jgi:hypothetical protein
MARSVEIPAWFPKTKKADANLPFAGRHNHRGSAPVSDRGLFIMKAAAKWLMGSMLALFLIAVLSETANAIPTFARKYRTSCTTCHIAIPKRNSFGEAFRRNGYRLPVDDEFAVKEDPVSLGAEPWKEIWPEAYWPGMLPASVPISFYGHQRLVWTEEQSGQNIVDTTFDAPHELEMLIGGTLGEQVSFFGEWIVFEAGKAGDGRLGSLLIQYNDLFGEDIMNFKIGRFDVGGLDGYNAFKEDNRVTLAHYGPNDYRVVPSSDKVNGNKINYRWRYRDKQAGLELNGVVADRFDYAIGIVNGNASVRDNNDAKDWYYSLRVKLLGDSITMTDAGGELLMADNWRDDSVTIGTHGYFGKTRLTAGNTGFWDNDFERFGFDVRAKYDRFELGGAYIFGNDDDPGGPSFLTAANERNIDSSAWMVELSYIIYPWLIPTFRYEETNFDKDFATDTEITVFNITALHTANLRWSLEWVHFLDDDDGADTVKANLLFAF